MCAADCLHACLGEAKVPNLALLDQILNRSGHVLDWHLWVDSVLVKQVDDLDVEPLERGFCDLPDMLGAAAQARLPTIGVDQKSELGGNHHPVTDRRERFPDKNLVRISPVDLGGVEERDAQIDCRPDHRDHLTLICGRAIAKAHAHTAEPDRRNFQAACSKLSCLHLESPCMNMPNRIRPDIARR